MKKIEKLGPEFVEFMPEELKEGILYVSLKYASVIHLCACGCGRKTVMPVSFDGWTLTFHNWLVTLHPSIGNFQFECRSHYWIKNNEIVWC